MNQTLYANIDDILGEQCKRFFSSGYKLVQHQLEDIQVNPTIQSTSAQASIFYPSDWSKKTDDTDLKPHLSTLDAFVLSLHLNSLFISSIYNLNESQKKHIWIRSVNMKSGSAALFNLEKIKVQTKLIKTETSVDSLCGHLTTFKTQIENMTIEMVIDHYVGVYDFDAKRYNKIEDAMNQVNSSYYGSYYRECTRDLFDVQIDTEKEKISAWIKINYPDRTNISDGISSMYYPFYTPIDTFVCAAQQIQALFYLLDGVKRINSNNLWMREIKYECKQPIYRPSGLKQTVSLLRSRVLNRNNSKWRIAEFGCELDSFPTFFNINVSVAHELPMEVELKNE
ncbi:AvrD family protein [Alkalihalobacillus hemicellulosilyticus]|uniref:Avirulence D protein n=1 Tax=Halalkalibacter hemicellulosilyticusJCM 9152 TaxID=1236971 RepID=W4QC94_9BACI|nr:AvrD family protein [Halalkalibacter hemicellulosilyticus]GAE29572.1 hypothetical protein JCM9152_936 [Halalkalibacter hemicellulosilyticusJCM 9152]